MKRKLGFVAVLVMMVFSFFLVGMAASPGTDLPVEFKEKNPALKLTVLEFSAPWCASCQKLRPSVDALLQEVKPRLQVVHLNIEQPETEKYLKRFDLSSVPTFILFDAKGKFLQKIERDITPAEFRTLVMKEVNKH